MINAPFNVKKNLKTPSFSQNPSTISGLIAFSTKDNITITSPIPAQFLFQSGKIVQKIPIAGYTGGIANGNQTQVIGDSLWEIQVDMKMYGDYVFFRNKVIELLQSAKTFALKTFTTQNNQTVPLIFPTSKKNYFTGFATNISFSDSYNGKNIGSNDSIKFTFIVVPEALKSGVKKSWVDTLDKCVNFLDGIQTNIAYASLQITNMNNTLIEFAKSISSFGSDASGFISSLRNINTSVGALVSSPAEVSKTFKTVVKDFSSLFSSSGSKDTRKYYTSLVSVAKVNDDVPLEPTRVRLKDGSYQEINDNIVKNVINLKTSYFLKAIAIASICNLYADFQFKTKEEGLEMWNNIRSLYEDFLTNEKLLSLSDIDSFQGNLQILEPEASNSIQDFIYSSLDSIRSYIFSLKDLQYKTITSNSNVYEVVGKFYGNLELLDNFMSLNSISEYYDIIKPNTEVRFL